VHCGVLSVGIRKKLGLPNNFDVRLGDPLAIVPLALRFPDLSIIIPHFGAGFFREALIAADLCSNIYLDTSSSNNWIKYHTNVTLTDVFQQVLDILGPDRLLFGSDSSFFPRGWQKPIFESQQAVLQEINADLHATQRIFYENFERIFAL
jgi:predicted TIM-barrel fold metal-dependent hydrolase